MCGRTALTASPADLRDAFGLDEAPQLGAHYNRMPLVLEPEAWDRWLDPGLTEPAAIERLLAPRAPELIAYAVRPYVNDPRHDDPSCLEPAPEPAQRTLF